MDGTVIESNDAPASFYIHCCSGSSESFGTGTDVPYAAVLQHCLNVDLLRPDSDVYHWAIPW